MWLLLSSRLDKVFKCISLNRFLKRFFRLVWSDHSLGGDAKFNRPKIFKVPGQDYKVVEKVLVIHSIHVRYDCQRIKFLTLYL